MTRQSANGAVGLAGAGAIPIPSDAPAGLPAPVGGAGAFDPGGFEMATATDFPDAPDGDPTEPHEDESMSKLGLAFNDALPMMLAGAMTEEEEDSLDELDPIERLRRLIEEREDETVQILRSWMEDDEEPIR